jgi:DNA-directed RNA polymerase specialized sigma24 family protein
VTDSPASSFADFVEQEHHGLLRLAVLLEDDRSDADELLRGVLVSVRARWQRLARSGDPVRAARRLLVRRVLARRPDDGPRTSGWVDDPYAGWDAGRHDDLRRGLSSLPVPTRAAVVLSLYAGLPDDEVGDLLRTPRDTVRGEVVAGLAPLRSVLAPVAAPWQLGARLPDDGDVRAELAALADDEAADVDPPSAAAEAEREVAARRRRRWPIAIAAAAAAVVVAVPVLHGGSEPSVPAADPPNRRVGWPADPDREGRATPGEVDISALPTRGSLADDADFLAGLLEQPWENEDTGDYPFDITTAEGSRRVLYAGDVAAGRWALLVGRPEAVDPAQEGIGGPFTDDGLYMAWFTGPAGAAPDDMGLSSFPHGLEPGMSPALLDPPSGTLVVVGAPGDAVEVSERVEVNADASDTRTWTPVRVDDGIAVADIDPVDLPWTWAVNYRIFRGDQVIAGTPDGMAATDPEPVLPEMGIDYPAGPPDAAGRRAAQWAAFIGLSSLGAPTDGTDVTARVVQPVPGGEGAVALVTVTLPSGAYLVSAQWAWDIGEVYPGGADCGLDVRPAEPPPAERLLVAVCEMYDPLDGRMLGTLLVASTPPGVAFLRLYRGDDSFAGELEVDGSALVTQVPAGTRSVEAVTAGGVLLGRSELLGHWSPTTD